MALMSLIDGNSTSTPIPDQSGDVTAMGLIELDVIVIESVMDDGSVLHDHMRVRTKPEDDEAVEVKPVRGLITDISAV